MDDTVSSPIGIFIGGTGRSGTNILKETLSLHPDMAALPFEPRFSVDPDGVFPTYRGLSGGASPFEMNVLLTRLERFLNRLSKRSLIDIISIYIETLLRPVCGSQLNLRAYKEWELEEHFPSYNLACKKLINDLSSAEYFGVWPGRLRVGPRAKNRISLSSSDPRLVLVFQEFYTKIYKEFLTLKKSKVVVDDNTYNLMYAKELAALLPNSHLVHVVRDPRDVVASFLHQRWSPSNVNSAIVFYKVAMDNILKSLNGIEGERLTIIRLEDFCQRPNEYIRKLEDKVGLSCGREFSKDDFLNSNQGRWQKDIPKYKHEKLNQELEAYIQNFGYATDIC